MRSIFLVVGSVLFLLVWSQGALAALDLRAYQLETEPDPLVEKDALGKGVDVYVLPEPPEDDC